MLKGGVKRVTALVFAVLMFSLAVSAAEITENPGKEFYVYGEKETNEKIAEILEETVDTLNNYCHNNGIIYLAVNEKNTKQIRLRKIQPLFLKALGNYPTFQTIKLPL